MFVYRIEKEAYKDELTGIGGTKVAGRWNFKMFPIIYTSESPSTARLECLLNWSLPSLPKNRYRMKIYIPDDASFDRLDFDKLPDGWDDYPHTHKTRMIGNNWLMDCKTLLLYVPCSEEPEACNVLINPRHPEFQNVRIEECTPIKFSKRLRP